MTWMIALVSYLFGAFGDRIFLMRSRYALNRMFVWVLFLAVRLGIRFWAGIMTDEYPGLVCYRWV